VRLASLCFSPDLRRLLVRELSWPHITCLPRLLHAHGCTFLINAKQPTYLLRSASSICRLQSAQTHPFWKLGWAPMNKSRCRHAFSSLGFGPLSFPRELEGTVTAALTF
jgi:hypothetical protein